MSQFTNHFSISPSPNKWGWWINKEEFTYHVGSEDSILSITVPAGYEFDGASVPYIFGSLIQKVEADTIVSACLHDYIYTNERHHGRIGADLVFLESCIIYNIPKLAKQGRYWKMILMSLKYIAMSSVLMLFSWFVWYKIEKRLGLK